MMERETTLRAKKEGEVAWAARRGAVLLRVFSSNTSYNSGGVGIATTEWEL